MRIDIFHRCVQCPPSAGCFGQVSSSSFSHHLSTTYSSITRPPPVHPLQRFLQVREARENSPWTSQPGPCMPYHIGADGQTRPAIRRRLAHPGGVQQTPAAGGNRQGTLKMAHTKERDVADRNLKEARRDEDMELSPPSPPGMGGNGDLPPGKRGEDDNNDRKKDIPEANYPTK